MGVDNAHTIYAVEAGAAVIGGIESQNIATGTDLLSEISSGDPWPRLQAIRAQKPTVGFNCHALKKILDVTGTMGKNIADLTGGLKMYARKLAAGGTRATGSSHRKFTFLNGILAPRTLTVNHQVHGVLSCEGIITYDGANDIVQIADDAVLPGGLTDDEFYSLGGMTIESVSLGHLRGFDLDFGLDIRSEGSDSDVWDTMAYVSSIRPVLTFRGIDPEVFKSSAIPLLGKAVTHANTTIYLRKYAGGGTFVADNVAEHIKITAAGLAHVQTPMDGSGNDPNEVTVVLNCQYDGTNDPVTIDTASTIT